MSAQIKYPKLDRRYKKRWLKALRSGKYKQHRGELCNIEQTKFCCLGVGCKIVRGGSWDEHTFTYAWESQTGVMPATLREKVGLSSAAEDHLTEMNDAGKSFRAIADWIEKHL